VQPATPHAEARPPASGDGTAYRYLSISFRLADLHPMRLQRAADRDSRCKPASSCSLSVQSSPTRAYATTRLAWAVFLLLAVSGPAGVATGLFPERGFDSGFCAEFGDKLLDRASGKSGTLMVKPQQPWRTAPTTVSALPWRPREPFSLETRRKCGRTHRAPMYALSSPPRECREEHS
jgi:hypothetical protein